MIDNIKRSIKQNRNDFAFCIDDTHYTYEDFGRRISAISERLKDCNDKVHSRLAIFCDNHIDTYASVVATWFSGMAFVPILSKNPIERNLAILREAKIATILSASELLDAEYSENFEVVVTNELEKFESFEFDSSEHEDLSEAYILFTSGSTGNPKGVPITLGNLNAFLDAFLDSGFTIEKGDRCLQMFELTFDVSISSFVTALISGACVYTVSDKTHKYIDVFRLINKYKLTSIQIVPSILKLGKPLYGRVDFSSIKKCILTGEATNKDDLKDFLPKVPNAQIFNYYGPTECTIYCSSMEINKSEIKSYNGLVSIGKPLKNVQFLLLNAQGALSAGSDKGELWVCSPQLTHGYLNKDLNTHSFKEIDGDIYYKTGDICFVDEEGDFLYCGRIDNQIQIQGFRVELGEVEFKCREKIGHNCVALDRLNEKGFVEIVLILETEALYSADLIMQSLSESLPHYMLPSKIHSFPIFPLAQSGKTDRVALRKLLENQ
jgi:D-alanine--poly(phosphoribitol) ligase subunit 1